MSGLSMDAAKAAKDDARQGNLRENDAGIPDEHRVDYEEHEPAEVKLHAESLVAFDHIARISINTYGNDDDLLAMEQNLEGAGKYGYTLELTVANPEVVEGQIWKESDAEYPEYKVISDPESDDNDYELREDVIRDDDGNVEGAEVEGIGNLGSSSWDGQPVDGFGSDYITIEIASKRARGVLGALDTAGTWFTSQDGDVREGLFEVPPTFGTDDYDADVDGYPRLTGYPELRADMVGQRGAISAFFGDANASGNRAKEVDVYRVTEDDGLEALVPLTPEDDAYALPTYPRLNNAFWDDGTSPSGADATPETDDGVAEARAMMDDADDSSGYDDLPEGAQDFVDDAVTALEAIDADSTDAFEDPDFATRVQTYDGTDDADPDVLASIVEGRV